MEEKLLSFIDFLYSMVNLYKQQRTCLTEATNEFGADKHLINLSLEYSERVLHELFYQGDVLINTFLLEPDSKTKLENALSDVKKYIYEAHGITIVDSNPK